MSTSLNFSDAIYCEKRRKKKFRFKVFFVNLPPEIGLGRKFLTKQKEDIRFQFTTDAVPFPGNIEIEYFVYFVNVFNYCFQ